MCSEVRARCGRMQMKMSEGRGVLLGITEGENYKNHCIMNAPKSAMHAEHSLRCSVVGPLTAGPRWPGTRYQTTCRRSLTFLWQLSPGRENFPVLVLLACTSAYSRFCDYALWISMMDTGIDIAAYTNRLLDSGSLERLIHIQLASPASSHQSPVPRPPKKRCPGLPT